MDLTISKTVKDYSHQTFCFNKRVEISDVIMTTIILNMKQVPVWVVNIRVQMFCFSYIAYPLPVIVRRICLFDNFEKLSMLLGFSRKNIGRVGEELLRARFLVCVYLTNRKLLECLCAVIETSMTLL